MSPPESGRESGGDLFDMAEKGTTVPDDAAKPRLIPSKPRPDQIPADSATDPTELGSASLAQAADNAGDIPRSTRDVASSEIITGTGDTLPSEIDSKRLHNVPGGVVHDPAAKGSTRYEKHHQQKGGDVEFGAAEGPAVEKAPGDEQLGDEEAMDNVEAKVGI